MQTTQLWFRGTASSVYEDVFCVLSFFFAGGGLDGDRCWLVGCCHRFLAVLWRSAGAGASRSLTESYGSA